MYSSVPDLDPRVCEAFDEACLAIFNTRVERPLRVRSAHPFLLRFAAHYRELSTLPRRTRRSMERHRKHTLSAIALLMALGQAPALAATLQVTAGTPPAIKADGRCSLIEAIVNANRDKRPHLDCVAGSGADTIVLPAQSQQVLNEELLPEIVSRIVIEGHHSTILRNPSFSHLTLVSVGSTGNLTLNETTLTGSVGSLSNGGTNVSNSGRIELNDSTITATGGFFSNGIVVLNNSRLTGNFAYEGGGGINNHGKLFVTNSVISGNSAYFEGGGINNSGAGTATLVDSIVSDNTARSDHSTGGGGIYNIGSLVLIGTTVANNRAHSGAGIVNAPEGTAMVRRSTISGNSLYSNHSGYHFGTSAGIENGGDLTLLNSTVSGNKGQARGGGVSSGNGALTILNSTVTGNTLTYYTEIGGGVYVSSGTLTLKRSIVSGNQAAAGPEIGVAAGVVVTANDFNLFGHDGDAGIVGFTPGSTDIVPNKSTGDILLPLADNGGDTRTHALAIGSPALDASPDDESCPTIDQRETPRPRGAACDIGSFEGSAVMCNGRVTTMVGTDGPDELTGTPGPDVIGGLSGNDTISSLGGNDLVCAGGGADEVSGGAGNDVLFGQDGDDRLIGNGSNDTLNGGTGKDVCNGGPGAGDTATACETVSTVP
jgi:hypothetical protein